MAFWAVNIQSDERELGMNDDSKSQNRSEQINSIREKNKSEREAEIEI